MSEFAVRIVRIPGFGKHPNADTLSITQVLGVNVIFRTGDFQVGDLAIYIPEDAVVPETVAGTEFLGTKRRIKAMRLRGIYSEGLLLPTTALPLQDPGGTGPPGYQENNDVADVLGITKYEEPIPPHLAGEAEKDPGCCPVYDVEPYGRYKHLLVPGEEVDITEKLHGTNARYFFNHKTLNEPLLSGSITNLMCGSRNHFWKPDERNLYWQMAKKYDLASKVVDRPLVVYGEIYGQVQDLKYGAKPGEAWLRVFDIFNVDGRRWLDWDEVEQMSKTLGLETVPVLYRGAFDPAVLEKLVEGKSALASHFREGVVVKPTQNRFDPHFGRVILKWVSETYKLRKNGTELR